MKIRERKTAAHLACGSLSYQALPRPVSEARNYAAVSISAPLVCSI